MLPSMILVGLMAIPYIDFNKLGNGYYTFNERKFAIGTFLFGFLPLWVAMIVLGTFLRGPNWNFFGPYEYWDVHKLELLNKRQHFGMVLVQGDEHRDARCSRRVLPGVQAWFIVKREWLDCC